MKADRKNEHHYVPEDNRNPEMVVQTMSTSRQNDKRHELDVRRLKAVAPPPVHRAAAPMAPINRSGYSCVAVHRRTVK